MVKLRFDAAEKELSEAEISTSMTSAILTHRRCIKLAKKRKMKKRRKKEKASTIIGGSGVNHRRPVEHPGPASPKTPASPPTLWTEANAVNGGPGVAERKEADAEAEETGYRDQLLNDMMNTSVILVFHLI